MMAAMALVATVNAWTHAALPRIHVCHLDISAVAAVNLSKKSAFGRPAAETRRRSASVRIAAGMNAVSMVSPPVGDAR